MGNVKRVAVVIFVYVIAFVGLVRNVSSSVTDGIASVVQPAIRTCALLAQRQLNLCVSEEERAHPISRAGSDELTHGRGGRAPFQSDVSFSFLFSLKVVFSFCLAQTSCRSCSEHRPVCKRHRSMASLRAMATMAFLRAPAYGWAKTGRHRTTGP
jgi:hypothetical protein